MNTDITNKTANLTPLNKKYNLKKNSLPLFFVIMIKTKEIKKLNKLKQKLTANSNIIFYKFYSKKQQITKY